MPPALTVIIPVYNGARTIERCLRAVTVDPDVECIVVDDGSDDGTPDVIRRFSVRSIRNPAPGGPARARNMGARLAKGEILAFIDADVEVHCDTLRKISTAFADRPDLDAIMGSYDDTPTDRSAVSQFKNLTHHYVHQQGRRSAMTFWAGCGAVRRQTYMRLGGMNELFRQPSVEDIEFGYRLYLSGFRCELRSEIQVKHLKAWTLAELIKTDVFRRAVPWTVLMLRAGISQADLNFSRLQRVSSLLLLAILAVLPFGGIDKLDLLVVLMLATLFVALNRAYYVFLARHGGIRFLFRAIPLHLLYCVYSAAGFGAGIVIYGMRMLLGRDSMFPLVLKTTRSEEKRQKLETRDPAP